MGVIGEVEGDWKRTACILCSVNCGIEVLERDGRFLKIKGDRAHPLSQGYACQKAQRLDYYLDSKDRVTSPLRRRGDGTFEPVSWETAISEIAAKLVSIRDAHGGETLAYYGGGGQGNHLGGTYGAGLRAAMGTPYIYTALAQEKTGGFWVDGKLFGRQNCHPTEDAENADYLLVIGANPWQSHGFPRARTVIQEIAKDPNRKLVVVDPRRTETAEKADVHLQVRPGGDAHLMLAMLGHIVQEGLADAAFLEERTVRFEELRDRLMAIPVDDYARHAGCDPELVRQVATEYAQTEKACLRTDLGLEHSRHSTLNTYLAKLLFLVTGHFGKPGTNTFHTSFLPLVGHSKDPEEGGITTAVTKTRAIGKLFPPNVLPQEIDSDDPKRIRGVVVDSGNPAMTGADSQAYRDAFEKLDLLVVIDVAMTETARLADYVLPAQNQYEKHEATFFGLDFPENAFHLRRPVVEPAPNTLPEPEIYRRLAVAMGDLPERMPLLEAVAKIDRKMPRLRLYPAALAATFALRPKLKRLAPLVLYATLGKALPHGAQSAALLWIASQMFVKKYGTECVERAGIKDDGAGHAEALFNKILESESGTLISVNKYEDTWSFVRHKDGKAHLMIPEMWEEIEALGAETTDDAYPFVLMAGERRSYNANTIYRNEAWRKKDGEGAMKMHPEDAVALGLSDGDKAMCESRRGSVEVVIELTDEVRPGVVSLPHGYGMVVDGKQSGPWINMLTASDDRDAIAKTPFHKFVPVKVTALVKEPETAAAK